VAAAVAIATQLERVELAAEETEVAEETRRQRREQTGSVAAVAAPAGVWPAALERGEVQES